MTEKGKEGRTETGVPFTSNETVATGKRFVPRRFLVTVLTRIAIFVFRLTTRLFECSELYISVSTGLSLVYQQDRYRRFLHTMTVSSIFEKKSVPAVTFDA